MRTKLNSSTTFLLILSGISLASSLVFLTINAHGHWDFILTLRFKKLLMLITVAYAIGISTLLFQTLTNNTILTPSFLGYDSLYILIQTLLIFVFGGVGFVGMNVGLKFMLETIFMMSASLLLFRTLTQQSQGDLARLILVGIIFGVLFRSINSILQRIMDPTQFVTAQVNYFAQFNSVNPVILGIGLLVMLLSIIWIWRMRFALDILMLGQCQAINLGINYISFSRTILLWIALLVSVSTALVGPISFFGLVVCSLVNILAPNMRHYIRLPAAFLMATIVLVIGQIIFEQLLGMQGALGIVIDCIGGITFLWLVLHQKRSPTSTS